MTLVNPRNTGKLAFKGPGIAACRSSSRPAQGVDWRALNLTGNEMIQAAHALWRIQLQYSVLVCYLALMLESVRRSAGAVLGAVDSQRDAPGHM